MSYATVSREVLSEFSLTPSEVEAIRAHPARQQPPWPPGTPVALIREELAARPGLVQREEVIRLRRMLRDVAEGRLQLLQAGDCAEDPAESTPEWVARKAGMLDVLAGAMTMVSELPVVRVGRMAGQYAKPRSQPTERVGGTELPSYRGHMINGPGRDLASRTPDPVRMLRCYDAASDVVRALRQHHDLGAGQVWTSHEALLLDFELPMIRRDGSGSHLLLSTHLPWVGNRTNHPAGAHVALLARVVNPLACKVGPAMTARTLVEICDRLDPLRDPGRLTLIARMGAAAISGTLPRLVAAVRAAGHPVIWLSDPMHANTIAGPRGHKVRRLGTIIEEMRRFQHAVAAGGGVCGGLHLEVTPAPVLECVRDAADLAELGSRYTTWCDPRLNLDQAIEVIGQWQRQSLITSGR